VVPEVRDQVRLHLEATSKRLGDRWHLDELFVTIQGRRQYLWRAEMKRRGLQVTVEQIRGKKERLLEVYVYEGGLEKETYE
jgi:transposase-like protein